MSNQHVLMIPYPVKGHIIPLLELAKCLSTCGFRITFVTPKFCHNEMINLLTMKSTTLDDQINLVSIPDGLESVAELDIPGRLSEVVFRILPGKLEELIIRMNMSEHDEISCVVADQSLGWALELASKLGVKRAAFLPAAAASLVLGFSIPKLIDDELINFDGTSIKHQAIQFEPTMPVMNTSDFIWSRAGNTAMQKTIFNVMVHNNKAVKSADFLICNSSDDLEPGAFSLAPEIKPIGPLLSKNRTGDSDGFFSKEDSTCLEWLDQQPPCSVLYIAFGSIGVLNRNQFYELAKGLELCNRPFLWVARKDIINGVNEVFLEEFSERISPKGKIVSWAPQQKVLDHSSVACFLSHCGWNSTVESLSNGVPILCWPLFADQFINQSYICDIWKIGMRLEGDASGVFSHDEIQGKVEHLFRDELIRERASHLKELMMSSVKEGGSSYNNFIEFNKWLKE